MYNFLCTCLYVTVPHCSPFYEERERFVTLTESSANVDQVVSSSSVNTALNLLTFKHSWRNTSRLALITSAIGSSQGFERQL